MELPVIEYYVTLLFETSIFKFASLRIIQRGSIFWYPRIRGKSQEILCYQFDPPAKALLLMWLRCHRLYNHPCFLMFQKNVTSLQNGRKKLFCEWKNLSWIQSGFSASGFETSCWVFQSFLSFVNSLGRCLCKLLFCSLSPKVSNNVFRNAVVSFSE